MEKDSKIDSKNTIVFFDFDNTITTYDVLDDMLVRFSRDKRWEELEEQWKNGKIGSRECLKGQVEGIGITKDELDKYLAKVTIDPFFKKLLDFLRVSHIPTVILSDNFDYILEKVLANNGIKNLKIYSNKLEFGKSRLMPHFIYTDEKCGNCAHCKKNTMKANVTNGEKSAYIGDGFSDRCASEAADIVFAKKDLLEYMKRKRIPHIPYNELKDVYAYLKENVR